MTEQKCNHKEGCTCGEHHDMQEMEMHETIDLILEDETEISCAVLETFEVDGKGYIALLPIDEEGEQLDDHPYFYEYTEDEDGDPVLNDIEDDEVYDKVVSNFADIIEEHM